MAGILAPQLFDGFELGQYCRNSITMVDIVKDALLAFARLHVLHHASEEAIFGLGMMKELHRHGYRMGAGTLYPLLHRLAADGLLASRAEVVGGKVRKYYVITAKGRKVLGAIAPKLGELAEEVLPAPSNARAAKTRRTNWSK